MSGPRLSETAEWFVNQDVEAMACIFPEGSDDNGTSYFNFSFGICVQYDALGVGKLPYM